MEEKYKNWLKKFGIAGFLFFLIKGILWLVFGTAIYKWLKTLMVFNVLFIVPFLAFTQVIIDENKTLNSNPISIHPPNLFNAFQSDKSTKPFFCRLEDKLNGKLKTPIKFRLGSLDYSNQMEYSAIRISAQKHFAELP